MKNLHCSQSIPQSGERCYTPADEYILYGCFNMHINETALCANHAMSWMYVQTKYKHACGTCNLLIEEYLTRRIHK